MATSSISCKEAARVGASLLSVFARLFQPGLAIGELRQRLMSDRTPGEPLAATPCPFGDVRARERITLALRSYLR